jgi:hypothetical protein
MANYLIHKNDATDDTEHHKKYEYKQQIIQKTEDRIHNRRDKAPIEELKPKKAPGEDAITAEIYQRVDKKLPITIYTIYNEVQEKGLFLNS